MPLPLSRSPRAPSLPSAGPFARCCSTVFYGSSIDFLRTHGWDQILVYSADVARAAWFPERPYVTQVFGGVLEEECNQLYDQRPR
jgi:hypothetical protein